jgi:hypothetical protein
MKKKEEASASLQLSVTRAGTTSYEISNVTKEDAQKVPLVYSLWGAARKLKENTAQLSTQAVANAAAVRAAAPAKLVVGGRSMDELPGDKSRSEVDIARGKRRAASS